MERLSQVSAPLLIGKVRNTEVLKEALATVTALIKAEDARNPSILSVQGMEIPAECLRQDTALNGFQKSDFLSEWWASDAEKKSVEAATFAIFADLKKVLIEAGFDPNWLRTLNYDIEGCPGTLHALHKIKPGQPVRWHQPTHGELMAYVDGNAYRSFVKGQYSVEKKEFDKLFELQSVKLGFGAQVESTVANGVYLFPAGSLYREEWAGAEGAPSRFSHQFFSPLRSAYLSGTAEFEQFVSKIAKNQRPVGLPSA